MSWLSLLWFAAIFAIFYLYLPWLARGKKGLVEGFVSTAFVMQFTILPLGAVGLALPGIVLMILFSWLGFEAIRNRPWVIERSWWRELTVRLLERSTRIGISVSLPRRLGFEAGSWLLLVLAYGYSRSAFAAGNLRFHDIENYSRALSLGVLSAGQPWQVDTSVPILLPLQILAALPSTAAVRFAGPIVGLLFVASVAWLAFEYSRNRNAALAAAAMCMVVPMWRGGSGGSELGTAELSATFAILAIALVRRSRLHAFLAATLSVAICVHAPWFTTVVAGVGCAAAAVAFSSIAQPARLAVPVGIATLVWFHPVATADGPHQYESAAQACEQIARTHHRNTWLLVSPGEELPFLYGRGWHVPLATFAADFHQDAVERPDFRFPYPVRDIFIFVEREPLRAGSSVARASLQFKAARMLAAYQRTHSDLKIFAASNELTVYHVPGNLPVAKQ